MATTHPSAAFLTGLLTTSGGSRSRGGKETVVLFRTSSCKGNSQFGMAEEANWGDVWAGPRTLQLGTTPIWIPRGARGGDNLLNCYLWPSYHTSITQQVFSVDRDTLMAKPHGTASESPGLGSSPDRAMDTSRTASMPLVLQDWAPVRYPTSSELRDTRCRSTFGRKERIWEGYPRDRTLLTHAASIQGETSVDTDTLWAGPAPRPGRDRRREFEGPPVHQGLKRAPIKGPIIYTAPESQRPWAAGGWIPVSTWYRVITTNLGSSSLESRRGHISHAATVISKPEVPRGENYVPRHSRRNSTGRCPSLRPPSLVTRPFKSPSSHSLTTRDYTPSLNHSRAGDGNFATLGEGERRRASRPGPQKAPREVVEQPCPFRSLEALIGLSRLHGQGMRVYIPRPSALDPGSSHPLLCPSLSFTGKDGESTKKRTSCLLPGRAFRRTKFVSSQLALAGDGY